MNVKKILFLASIMVFILILGCYTSTILKVSPYVTNQWAIKNSGQTVNNAIGKKNYDLGIYDVWKKTKGSKKVIVGIIDTGLDISSQSLRDSIFVNINEIPNNNLDDDNNGFIDDINGWNFYENNGVIFTDSLTDYHGNIIANIIGASHSSNKYLGIAPDVTLLQLKCFAGSKGDLKDAIKAIEYAYEMGAEIINISWDSNINDVELYNTISKYPQILFVCAAGKTMNDLTINTIYPACYDLENIITVAATNNNGELYPLSGYGMEVDFAAPGENIYSMLPNNTYIFSEGTSMAAAYTSGIASLVLSHYNEISIKQLRNILMNGVMQTSTLAGKMKIPGIINASKCFDYAELELMKGE